MKKHRPTLLGISSEQERQFLSALDKEILEGERLRATIVVIVCALSLVSFLAAYFFVGDKLVLFRQQRQLSLRIMGILGALTFYEVLLRGALQRFLTFGKKPPWPGVRYINAVLEISIPSLLMYFFTSAVHPIYGLLTPPMLLYFFFISVSALRLDFRLCVFTGSVAAVEYLLIYAYAISIYKGPALPWLTAGLHHYVKAGFLILCGITAGVVTQQIKKFAMRSLSSLSERNRVTALFGLYVSPKVVDTLLEQRTELDGELRKVCVLFLDIRNFTQFSEKRPPADVVQYLNSLFGFMIDIINQHSGIINKFLGDGFMAIFGAPLQDGKECDHAVAAALQIVAHVKAEVEAGHLPPTRIGIGIHFGEVLTGSIGSPRRKEYTIIGDTVNLAARIEQMTKQLDAQVLASQSVVSALTGTTHNAEPLGEVAVRGREAPLNVYRFA